MRSLSQFYEFMDSLQTVRRTVTGYYLMQAHHPRHIQSLRNALSAMDDLPGEGLDKRLDAAGRTVTVTIDYERSELEKDIYFLITRHFLQSGAPANPVNQRNPTNPSSFNRPHEPHNFASFSQRRLWMCRSHDFLHWSEPVVICAADDEEDNLDESFYGMPLFRVGGVYLGTVGVLHQVDNTMDVQLLTSRDTIRWSRTAGRAPFFAPSESGGWDSRMVSMVSSPIEVGDELWFYHGGTAYHHDWFLRGPVEGLDHPEARAPEGSDFGLGLATLRKDGFAGLAANELREGFVCTRAMRGVGRSLVVNGRCGRGGSIRVEVVDAHDTVVSECTKDRCDPFTGDSVRHTMTWKGNPTIAHRSEGEDDAVCKLRFFLKDAELFSFRFETDGP